MVAQAPMFSVRPVQQPGLQLHVLSSQTKMIISIYGSLTLQ